MTEPPGALDLILPVQEGEEILGAVGIRKDQRSPATPADRRLVEQLASHAALLFENLRLTAALERRVEEIAHQRARRIPLRLVTAQDDERRRIEREIHDGAQQDLVAVMAKVRLAQNAFRRDGMVSEGARRAVSTRRRGVRLCAPAPRDRRLGYVLKERLGDVDERVRSLTEVVSGRSVIDAEVVDALVARRMRPDTPIETLTPRELDVLHQMAQGRTNAVIAAELFLSESAVEKHGNSIFSKLGLREEPLLHRRVMAVLTYPRGRPA
ncbi:MAG: hypothetical protein NVSMB16_07690 [Acidimicrobiales bacterium]